MKSRVKLWVIRKGAQDMAETRQGGNFSFYDRSTTIIYQYSERRFPSFLFHETDTPRDRSLHANRGQCAEMDRPPPFPPVK